ncbi:MAG: hypothetical protein DRJ61_10305 [Acidobacteria bacterium]|nr:MAG: hypothetical protein DRJ61_10305 [Acidobacteriota bacterium]
MKRNFAFLLVLGLMVVPALAAGPDVVVRTGPADRGGSGSWDYIATADSTGTSYPWIDATGGTNIGNGDDSFLTVPFPFDFQVYDDLYTTADVIEVNTNGSLHFDQSGPRSLWVNCGEIPSDGDGQWVAPLGDDLISDNIWWIVTGTAPNQVFTVEWEVQEYSGGGAALLEVSLYEGTNAIVAQVQILNPFAFGGDGVVGINAGDAIWGEELFCGSSGTIPSNDFDVEFASPMQPTPTPEPTATPDAIPTTSRGGIALMVFLLVGAAFIFLRRRMA